MSSPEKNLYATTTPTKPDSAIKIEFFFAYVSSFINLADATGINSAQDPIIIGNAADGSIPIEKARDIIKGIVDKIKGFFSGLKISLPHIKLPHFSIKGSFSLAPPSVPHLSIDWYKKAMDKPMLLNGATIFGQRGNTLLGGGEAGPEVIMGLDTLQSMAEGSNQNLAGQMTMMMNLMMEYFPQFASASVTLDSGTMVGAMAPQINTALGKIANQKGKGW